MHALAHCKANILGADIVLEIDESLRVRIRPGAFGSTDHAAGPLESLLGMKLNLLAAIGAARGACHQLTSGQRFLDRRLQPVRAVAGTDRKAILNIGARQETLLLGIEFQLAARLRKEMN